MKNTWENWHIKRNLVQGPFELVTRHHRREWWRSWAFQGNQERKRERGESLVFQCHLQGHILNDLASFKGIPPMTNLLRFQPSFIASTWGVWGILKVQTTTVRNHFVPSAFPLGARVVWLLFSLYFNFLKLFIQWNLIICSPSSNSSHILTASLPTQHPVLSFSRKQNRKTKSKNKKTLRQNKKTKQNMEFVLCWPLSMRLTPDYGWYIQCHSIRNN